MPRINLEILSQCILNWKMFLDTEDDPYDIEVGAAEFRSIIEEAADRYADLAGQYSDEEADVDVTVRKYVEDRPERFVPLSTRLQGPLVVVEYELEYGRQTFRTRDWAEYRDRDREEALTEAELELPDEATVDRI